MEKILVNEEQNLISYNDKYTYTDGSYVSIKGSLKFDDQRNFDLKDLENKLVSCFKQRETAFNLPEAIYTIRTIFNMFGEQSLMVKTKNSTGVIQAANYNNELLTKYRNSISLKKEEIIEIVNQLTNIKGKKDLTSEESILCKTYSLFYGEFPDFRLLDCIDKANLMAAILSKKAISLIADDYCSIYENGLPYSHFVIKSAYNLQPLGLIRPEKIDVHFEEEIENKISLIGNFIRTNMKNNFAKEIEILSRVIYVNEFVMPVSLYGSHEVASFVGDNKDDIIRCLSLVREIDSL